MSIFDPVIFDPGIFDAGAVQGMGPGFNFLDPKVHARRERAKVEDRVELRKQLEGLVYGLPAEIVAAESIPAIAERLELFLPEMPLLFDLHAELAAIQTLYRVWMDEDEEEAVTLLLAA